MRNSFSILETIFAIMIFATILSSLPKIYESVKNMSENIFLKSSFSEDLKILKSHLIEDKNLKNLNSDSEIEINIDEVESSSLEIVEFYFQKNGETLFQFHTFQNDQNWSDFKSFAIP
ncbi:hypothetical protein ThvES_00011730 [Thiovulum sp. ES]|nr:hypothetical protein ThvES_00011730 [Thiovulum sp. ES]